MIGTDIGLDALKRQRPEWDAWLTVVNEVLREMDRGRWDASVPSASRAGHTSVPALAGAEVAIGSGSVRRLMIRLIRFGARAGTPKLVTLEAALHANLDALALFTASVRQAAEPVRQAAQACGADEEALQAVVALVAVPFLQACHRCWQLSLSGSWIEGYCPVCASWPAFAEVRGIERNRYFRCGRCGAAWHARALWCPYCGTADHHELASLSPRNGSQGTIEGCHGCGGYVKTFTVLQGCPPAAVMLQDLATVDFDVAALAHGYARPAGTGYPLDAQAVDRGGLRRFFAWQT